MYPSPPLTFHFSLLLHPLSRSMGLHFLTCLLLSPSFPPSLHHSPEPTTWRASNLFTKTSTLHLRQLGAVACARSSSFADSFGRGVDKSFDVSLECNLPHGDEEEHRIASRRSLDTGFWGGLSLAQRGGLESTKNAVGSFGVSSNELGPCHLGSLDTDSIGCNDSSTIVPTQEPCGEELGSSKRAPGGREAGVGIPLSLKMLKRRKGRGKLAAGLVDVGSSLREAFSSMVFMMKTLQSHTLQIRGQLFYEEVEELLNMVQREMHMSFLWLFQQVFSCTPELMILVMIMLANFTVYSMGNNLSLAAISSPSSSLAMSSSLSDNSHGLNAVVSVDGSSDSYRVDLEKALEFSPPLNETIDLFHTDDGRVGNGGTRDSAIAGGDDDDPPLFEEATESRAMYSEEDMMPPEVSSMGASVAFDQFGRSQTQNPSNSDDFWYSNARELDGNVQSGASLESTGHSNYVVLERDTMQSLVAPIRVQLEDDDYLCYDRTDLVYQHAMSTDSTNSLLLANYAQFLFLVRRDHNRAEELFHRAMVADPSDSDAMGRFATFLWLARRNLAAAEKAYRAAAFADPGNSFHAANYAHFLWHSGQ